MSNIIEERQIKEKQLVLEELKKTPIVQITCQRAGIGRATYYRWKKEDMEFSKNADEAIHDGVALINDMAESKLILAIKAENFSAIAYWLNHRHPAYLTKVEITSGNKEDGKLTAEQEDGVKKALIMAGIVPAEIKKQPNE